MKYNEEEFYSDDELESNEEDQDLDFYNAGFKRFIYDRNKAKKRKQRMDLLDEAKRIKERREKRRKFFKKASSSIINWIGKLFDPAVIIYIASSFVVYRRIETMQAIQEKQAQQQTDLIQTIQQDINSRPNIKRGLQKNWPKIVLASGTILIPAGKSAYNHWKEVKQLKANLNDAEVELNQTKERSQAQLEKSQTELQKSQTELQKSQTDLQKYQTDLQKYQTDLQKSQDDLEKEKDQSQIKLDNVQKENKIYVEKLHLTLNRFNKATLNSAKVETDLRTRIAESTNKLAQAIEERDAVVERLNIYEEQNDLKFKEKQDLQLEVKVLKNNLNDKEDHIARLATDLEKQKADSNLWIFKTSALEREIKHISKSRDDLIHQVSNKTREMNKLDLQQKRLQENYRNQQIEKERSERAIQKLKSENERYQASLVEANQKTNNYAMKMDEVNHELVEYKRNHRSDQQTISQQSEFIANKQKEIFEIAEHNQQLKHKLGNFQKQLNQTVILNDQLKSQKDDLDKRLKEADPHEKQQLKNQIKAINSELKTVENQNSKLKKTIRDQNNQISDGLAMQENLIRSYQDLEAKYQGQEESFLSRLQSDRKQQEEKFDQAISNAQQLVNNLLNQQESDQKLSWWQKMKISIHPSVSIKEKQKSVERDSYFYPSSDNDMLFPTKVSEKFDPKTGKWSLQNKDDDTIIANDNFKRIFRRIKTIIK